MDAPAWLGELDLRAGPPEAAMGTRTLDNAMWFLVDREWTAQRNEARRLLDERRAQVLGGGASRAAEVLDDEVSSWLSARHPALMDDPDDPDALARARRRVADDLCILVPGPGGWVLAAGCVCFPSYWRLSEKLGRPLALVHDPVPGYPGSFATRVDTFLSRLRERQGVWRRNWSIHPTQSLFAPTYEPGPLPPVEDRWLRSEYQTLRRLPGIDAIAFTIRTQQVPLRILRSRPGVADALLSALHGWTAAQRTYKGGAVDDALVEWLHDAASPSA